MATTQAHLPVKDIKNGLVLLKDGSVSLVLETSAINFGLLSDREQLAIIESFGQFLNSLSFSIQISILSQRLDISSYLYKLDFAQKAQTNPLLLNLMDNYRKFIQSLIKENEVLDKRFYIVITLSPLELGLGFNRGEDYLKKAAIVLSPRRDQIVRLLARVGLKTNQLASLDLLNTVFHIYNQPYNGASAVKVEPVVLDSPPLDPPQRQPNLPPPLPNQKINPPPSLINQQPRPRNHPFVVEELVDNI